MLHLDLNIKKETCLQYAAELIKKKNKKAENLEVEREIVSSEKACGFSKINSSAAQ